MKAPSESRSRRIVAVFGGRVDGGVAAVLESLASAASVDISGVFLEDQTLFRLAELPFATELCRVTTVRRPLRPRELERQMRSLASRAEQAVRLVAERAGSPWTFRTHRGRLSSALEGSSDVDLVLIGASGDALIPAGELGAMARAFHATHEEGSRSVVALLDRPSAAARVLEAGAGLAGKAGRALAVLVPLDEESPTTQVADLLARVATKGAQVRTFQPSNFTALLSAVRKANPAVLVVGGDASGIEEDRIASLQRALRCPLVVVR